MQFCHALSVAYIYEPKCQLLYSSVYRCLKFVVVFCLVDHFVSNIGLELLVFIPIIILSCHIYYGNMYTCISQCIYAVFKVAKIQYFTNMLPQGH